MKLVSALSAAFLGLAAFGPPVEAQPRWQVDLALGSDTIVRGYERSGDDPALQAGVSVRPYRGLFVGVLAGSVDYPLNAAPDDRADVELQGYVGYGMPLGRRWSAEVVALRYEVLDVEAAYDVSYSEYTASVRFRDLLQLTWAYTPELFGGDADGSYLELAGRYPLPGKVDLFGGFGRSDLDVPIEPGYSYWHAGAARGWGPLTFEVGWYDSDAAPVPRWGRAIDGEWVLSVSAGFPQSE